MAKRPRKWPPHIQHAVTQRQGGKFCTMCRELEIETPLDVPLELDHLQPISKGGTNEALNLRWLCRSHNRGRQARGFANFNPRWNRQRRPED
jgi:5-methylcytosine-specific restriction endonuclease McrA